MKSWHEILGPLADVAYHVEDAVILFHGDCREILPRLGRIATATLSDPPYGLGFMGKDWDHGVPGPEFWRLISGACKPGAMCMAFGGTRTFHRLACAIEDAGWEIRDCLMWIYGSGFPKSLDISKAIDKSAGEEREITGKSNNKIHFENLGKAGYREEWNITSPATEAAKQWDGWGSALKPAYEPIILAMNPLDGTFADNALKHGVAGLNIDGGRIPTSEEIGRKNNHGPYENERTWSTSKTGPQDSTGHNEGRWPSNVIHDGSDEVVGMFPVTESSEFRGATARRRNNGMGLGTNTERHGTSNAPDQYGDSGSAARFFKECKRIFYTSKASRADRGEDNNHPTVKPLSLIKYLLMLLQTPTGGIVCDPFLGSGTTALAAKELNMRCIGMDTESKYLDIAIERLRQGVLDLGG